MQALAVTPVAAPALLAQQAAAPATLPELKFATPDIAAETVLQFFDTRQFATLSRLSRILEPATGTAPGAVECGAPEFLDFLLSVSPQDRQQSYLAGLDALEHNSQQRFGKSFADANDAQAAQLIEGLRQPWTYTAPDALTAFLRDAKEDIRTAARNSEAYAKSGAPGAGGGPYWMPVE